MLFETFAKVFMQFRGKIVQNDIENNQANNDMQIKLKGEYKNMGNN